MKKANQCAFRSCDYESPPDKFGQYGLVGSGNWNENNRQANFSNDNLENENDNARLRATVMVMRFVLRAAILQACGRFQRWMLAV